LSPEDCIFCRIVAGTTPADVVLSDDQVVAFRDINPQAPVHVQIVPRLHIKDASELGPDHAQLLSGLFQAARSVADAEGIAERGYRLLFNVGKDAANTVGHLHLHLVGGRRLGWPPG
jgi:histidine triad (HIT) family protein